MKKYMRRPIDESVILESQAIYAKEIGKLFLLLSKKWSKKAKKLLTV